MSIRTDSAPGLVLLAGIAAVIAAATAPAGLSGAAIPLTSWATWAGVLMLALYAFGVAGVPPLDALRRLLWLLPLIALLALPAGLLSPPGRRTLVTLGLAARAFASASVVAALASWLGPRGLVQGARSLHVPARFVAVLAAALAGIDVVIRQAMAMLRAREARRPGYGAWGHVIAAPGQTATGFGRLVASLLLRSLERGEALERARRARGVGE